MKSFLTLLNREWLEWRITIIVVLAVFVVGLAALGYGSYRFSRAFEDGHLRYHQMENNIHWQSQSDSLMDSSHVKLGIIKNGKIGDSNKVVEVFGHMVRIAISTINFILMLLIASYLADAIYKERSDGSTYYYRSLPVSDWSILLSKLCFGFVGILLLSYVLGIILTFYLKLIVPGVISTALTATGYSLGQISMGNLFGGWATFHLLEFLWLAPYAIYFLLVSTVVKNRPVLIAGGILILIALVWKYSFGLYGVSNPLLTNLTVIGDVLTNRWMDLSHIAPSESIQLFGSFWKDIFSLRTLISVIVAVGLFWTTRFFYQKNIEVS